MFKDMLVSNNIIILVLIEMAIIKYSLAFHLSEMHSVEKIRSKQFANSYLIAEYIFVF